jgi:5-methylthioadenosine/S-adenosylhomocysteine deaminase
MATLIRDAIVIPMDPERRVLARGAVLIEGHHIADVGPTDEIVARHPRCDRVIDGHGKIVIPGFVSCHNHVGYTLFRSRAEELGSRALPGLYLPMATVVSREERLAVGSLTYAELLRGGVTTVLNMEEDGDVYAPFVERLGLRSQMGVMIRDVLVDGVRHDEYKYDSELGRAQIKQAADFAEQWHGKADGRISVIMSPNMTFSSSPEQLRATREVADRLHLRMSIHLGSGASESDITRRLHGKDCFAYAHDHGLLAHDVVAAHCCVMDKDEFDLLVRSGAAVAHCPLMNAVRGRIAPVTEMLRRGVRVGLGLDNMFGDYFDVLRTCVLVARIHAGSATEMLVPQALELATIGGARALGMEREIGSLEIGKYADVVMVDAHAYGLVPTLDPIQILAYHAHACNVEMVLVGGNILVDQHKLLTADEATLLNDAEQATTRAWQRFATKYGGLIAA